MSFNNFTFMKEENKMYMHLSFTEAVYDRLMA